MIRAHQVSTKSEDRTPELVVDELVYYDANNNK